MNEKEYLDVLDSFYEPESLKVLRRYKPTLNEFLKAVKRDKRRIESLTIEEKVRLGIVKS